MSFSLITAVYGTNKLNYITRLILSIIKQGNIEKELIIVDQNKCDTIQKLIDVYKHRLEIIYLKSPTLGLSKARNIGLDFAKYDIIAFPDDDCEFPEKIFEKVIEFFHKKSEYEILITSVLETYSKYRLRFTNRKNKGELKKNEIFTNCCSISIFHKVTSKVYFDEDFGLGSKFRSCEDYDYVTSISKINGKIFFDPELNVLHPDSNKLSKAEILLKINNNAFGHGAYFSKYFYYIPIVVIYNFLAPLAGIFVGLLTINIFKIKMYYNLFYQRVLGFIKFKKEK